MRDNGTLDWTLAYDVQPAILTRILEFSGCRPPASDRVAARPTVGMGCAVLISKPRSAACKALDRTRRRASA